MVEAVASFQNPSIPLERTPKSYEDAINDPQVIAARTLSEQNTLILRLLRPQETVLFEATSVQSSSFEAHDRKMHKVLDRVRARRQKEKDILKTSRIEALKRIDAQGYSWDQILNPIKP